jgi:hypothetical protein
MSLTAKIISIEKKSKPKSNDFGWYNIEHKDISTTYSPTIALLTPYGAIYFTLFQPGEPYKMSYSTREYFDDTYIIKSTYEADLTLKLKEI